MLYTDLYLCLAKLSQTYSPLMDLAGHAAKHGDTAPVLYCDWCVDIAQASYSQA